MTSSNGSFYRVTSPFCGEFTGHFPSQRPGAWSFSVFFDGGLNKRLSKQSRRWWFETPSCSLWRHCNEVASLSPKKTYHCKMPVAQPWIIWVSKSSLGWGFSCGDLIYSQPISFRELPYRDMCNKRKEKKEPMIMWTIFEMYAMVMNAIGKIANWQIWILSCIDFDIHFTGTRDPWTSFIQHCVYGNG